MNHYNHNIETSPRYFPEIVQSHGFEDRVETLQIAKEAGMDLCAGVILGMGESPTDRVDAAMALQDIGVSSLPVNILNPVEGTPLAERGLPDITTKAVIKTIAVYRLLHPEARVRLTGGREVNLDTDGQVAALEAGADGILTGDYLTTSGQSPADDIEIVEQAGLEPNTAANDFDPDAVKARRGEENGPKTAAGSAQSTSELESDN